MKSKFYLLAILVIANSACISKEEKQAKLNEQLAIECVRATLKCPSTMQVSSVCQNHNELQIDRDTMYHVKSKHGKFTNYGYGLKFWDRVDAVTVDSLREFVRTYPAHTFYTVTYDAQNSYGAMVRENTSVVILEDGTVQLWDSFFYKCYENAKINTWAIEPIKYSNIKKGLEYTLDEGKWVSKRDIFDVPNELVSPIEPL